jgi:hypothetical protein
MNRGRLVAALSVAVSLAAFADDADAGTPGAEAAPPPPADEIKRVLDYQDNGKDRGPALLDLVACLKVDGTKNAPTSFTCVEPIKGPVKKGTTVNAWTQWFCPRGGKYEDVSFQWVHEGQVRSTTDLTIEGLARTRTWRAQTLNKPGKWQVKVLRGSAELGVAEIVVQP